MSYQEPSPTSISIKPLSPLDILYVAKMTLYAVVGMMVLCETFQYKKLGIKKNGEIHGIERYPTLLRRLMLVMILVEHCTKLMRVAWFIMICSNIFKKTLIYTWLKVSCYNIHYKLIFILTRGTSR